MENSDEISEKPQEMAKMPIKKFNIILSICSIWITITAIILSFTVFNLQGLVVLILGCIAFLLSICLIILGSEDTQRSISKDQNVGPSELLRRTGITMLFVIIASIIIGVWLFFSELSLGF